MVNAKPRSGTMRKPERWPVKAPPCWTMRTPSELGRSIQASPMPSSSAMIVPPGPGLERIATSAAEQPRAVRRRAVAQVEAGVLELVPGAGACGFQVAIQTISYDVITRNDLIAFAAQLLWPSVGAV